jgi:ATP-dependent Lon protease
MVTPLFVGRPRSIQALEAATAEQRLIFLTTQRDPKIDDPLQNDLYEIGVIGQIIQLLKLPDGTVKVLIEGKERARIVALEERPECLYAKVVLEEELLEDSDEIEAMSRSVLAAFESYINLSKKIPPEMFSSISGITAAGRLADAIIPQLNVKVSDKQQIMEQINPLLRLENLLTLLEHELQILSIEKKIRSRVKSQMERSQKEYYLNEQMRACHKELGVMLDFKL